MSADSATRSMLSAAQGARLLEIDRTTFARLAAQGHFTTLNLPGLPTRYSRVDIEAFRDHHTIPATRPAAGKVVAS